MSADTDGLDAAAFAVSDLTAVKATLEGIDASALRVSKTLSGAFASAIVGGKSFNETLTIIAASLTKVFLSAGLQPLTQGLTSMLTSGLGSLVGAGGATPVAPFAEGGVVASPTFFGSGKSLGLMGERGAEPILPLAPASSFSIPSGAWSGRTPWRRRAGWGVPPRRRQCLDRHAGRRKFPAFRGADRRRARPRRRAGQSESVSAAYLCGRAAVIWSSRRRRCFFMSSRWKSSVASICASTR